MPDYQGKLTVDETKKAEEWFKTNWHLKKCPVSGHENWTIGQHLVHTPIFTGGGLVIGGLSYPQIMVFCQGCGYTLYFNAVMMGIVPGSTQ